jgi:Alcohol dehydrogenase GroES-like domain
MRAVQFDRYGDEDVLEVREVPDPQTAPGRLVVAVKAASINPGEMSIREGALHEVWPATFPSGQGSDFAGTVAEVGDGVDRYAVGDAVLGYSDERGSHAELVSAPAEHVVAKPDGLPVGGRRVDVRRARRRLGMRVDRRAPARRDGRRVQRRRRRGVGCRAARAAHRCDGHRPRQPPPTTTGCVSTTSSPLRTATA